MDTNRQMKNWNVDTSNQGMSLTPKNNKTKGWYEVCVNKKDANSDYQDLGVSLSIHAYRAVKTIPFTVTSEGLKTYFYVGDDVTCIDITSVANVEGNALNIEFRKCLTPYALYRMMSFISQRDKNNNNNPKRIYNKSYARFKRHGYEGFLQRLLKEYHRADTYILPENDMYQLWIHHNEKKSEELIQQRIQQLVFQPKISIVMATWRSQLTWLSLAIESVKKQSYVNWELCIADDASDDEKLVQFLQVLQNQDERIKVVFREERGHISLAQNSALAITTGDYVTFLDHDDLLADNALLSIVEELQINPSAKLLYSDEDKIGMDGRRTMPHFKSDWNPDLLLAQNYITHLMIADRQLVMEVNGFRAGVEGSQDHDLILRLTANLQKEQIVHIAKILYHWRIVDGSTALSANSKQYTSVAGIKALQDYFISNGDLKTKVALGLSPNTYRIRYALPQPAPLVSLLIPTKDKLELLKPCIRSILDKTDYSNYEILIINNGSVEKETLSSFESIQLENNRVKVIDYNYPFNYSAINNFAVEHAQGEVIGLINNDVEVINEDWLTELVSHACRPQVGCVGAKLYFSDGALQHAGVILGIGGVAGHSHKYFAQHAHGYFSRLEVVQNLSAVTGACLLVKKELYTLVGGLDEVNLKIAFNDVDFCLKVREAGYLNVWTPFAKLYHHESKSRGAEDTPEKQARFQQEVLWMQAKWGEKLKNDPYYNVNLTLDHEDFSVKLKT